jgi:hypothetical protein
MLRRKIRLGMTLLTSLHRNPFWSLQLTTREDRSRILEAADERALSLDPAVCQKARSDLLNPRARLAAEVGWFPGLSPNRAKQAVNSLERGLADLPFDSGLPPLARANVIAAALECVTKQVDIARVVECLAALSTAASEIDAETTFKEINEDRLVAKFPLVNAVSIVEEELAARHRHFRNAAKEMLNSLPTEALIRVLNQLIELLTEGGTRQAPPLIEELVDVYETEAQEFMQKEVTNLERLLAKAKSSVSEGEAKVLEVFEAVWKLVDNWNRVIKPVARVASLRGGDHAQSRRLANEIRQCSIAFHNEQRVAGVCKAITDRLQSSFSYLPEFLDSVAEDASFLAEAAKERAKEAEREAEWQRSINFSAEVGIFSKTALKISSLGIQWDGRLHKLETVTTIRWGATSHSINGIPTGTTYEIIFGIEHGREIFIRLKRSETFSGFTEMLWRAVGLRLLLETLAKLKAGKRLAFGGAVIEDNAVTLQRHGFFSKNESLKYDWGKVSVWSANGSFVIGAQDDKKVYVELPYLSTPNLPVLEQIIRGTLKKNKVRLSAFLD